VIGYSDTFYDVPNYSASWTGEAGNMHMTFDDLAKATKPLGDRRIAERCQSIRVISLGRDGVGVGFCIGRREGRVGDIGDVPGFQAGA
jgi:hypothetical protein